MLHHISGVLTPQELAWCRERLDHADWADGRATAGTQSAAVKCNRQIHEKNAVAREVGQRILQALERSALFFSAALPAKVFPPLFNRYSGGEHFGNHVDNAVRTHSLTGERLRTDLSCTLFLSEPESYSGGELVIEDAFGCHSVKLAAGDLVLYPSSSLHRVEPVTEGERQACFFWLQSMVRDDGQRRILLDMDMAVAALRAQHGESPELMRLTGAYHNLLRRWAQV